MKNECLQRLEPYELKNSRTVLRREKMSNHLDLVVKRIFGNAEEKEIDIRKKRGKNKAIEVDKNSLKAGLDIDTIISITGLEKIEIEKLL